MTTTGTPTRIVDTYVLAHTREDIDFLDSMTLDVLLAHVGDGIDLHHCAGVDRLVELTHRIGAAREAARGRIAA